jgi:hypothetical protein
MPLSLGARSGAPVTSNADIRHQNGGLASAFELLWHLTPDFRHQWPTIIDFAAQLGDLPRLRKGFCEPSSLARPTSGPSRTGSGRVSRHVQGSPFSHVPAPDGVTPLGSWIFRFMLLRGEARRPLTQHVQLPQRRAGPARPGPEQRGFPASGQSEDHARKRSRPRPDHPGRRDGRGRSYPAHRRAAHQQVRMLCYPCRGLDSWSPVSVTSVMDSLPTSRHGPLVRRSHSKQTETGGN